MPWHSLLDAETYRGLPALTVVFVIIAVIVLRFAPPQRKAVRHIATLYGAALLVSLLAVLFRMAGNSTGERYGDEIALLLASVCLVLVSGKLLFNVILPLLRLYPPRILQDVMIAVALIVFGFVRLHTLGMDPSSIFTTSALLTAVIALSLQDTLGNILGGLALQVDRSIQVGDWVRIDNLSGQVVEVGWRQTSIETNDWETIVVPNSVLVKNRFLVLGRRTGKPVQLRRWVPFYVDNSYSPQDVNEIVQESLRGMDIEHVSRNPPAQCFVIEMAENPARYSVSYWLTDLTAMNPTDSMIRTQAFLALKRAGIPIANPTATVILNEDTAEKRNSRQEQEVAQRMMALRAVDIFRGFNVDELTTLAGRLQPAPYVQGDVLVRQGAAASRLYIIVEGRADVFVESSGGERARVAELGPGDFFGEMGLMTGEPRTATVIAKTKMLCYRIDKHAFADLITSRTDVAEEISTLLAKRRSELEATREDLSADAAAARAAANKHAIRQKIWQFFGIED